MNLKPCEAAMSDEVEQISRLIAARKMGLVKDPTRARLPESLWRRYIGQATELLRSNDVDEVVDLVYLLVQPV